MAQVTERGCCDNQQNHQNQQNKKNSAESAKLAESEKSAKSQKFGGTAYISDVLFSTVTT